MTEVEALMDYMWPTLRHVHTFGRSQFWNKEETRKLCEGAVSAMNRKPSTNSSDNGGD